MGLIIKGLRYLKTRGVRAFFRAVYAKIKGTINSRRVEYDRTDFCAWLRSNINTETYAVQKTGCSATGQARHHRNFAIMYDLCHHASAKQIIAVSHSIGGGAEKYLADLTGRETANQNVVITVRYKPDIGKYLLEFNAIAYRYVYRLRNFDDLLTLTEYLPCSDIYVNNLVTYPDIYETLGTIIRLKKASGAALHMFVHDYYPLCSTIQMVGCDGRYCNIPDSGSCEQCYRIHCRGSRSNIEQYISVKTWRENWLRLLQECDRITVFSGSSRDIMEKAFGDDFETLAPRIQITPHRVEYIPKLNKKYKTTTTLNIGLLGVLTEHKGLKTVCDMISYIGKQGLNVNVVLIGSSVGLPGAVRKSGHYTETGEYAPCEIPSLTLRYDIDIFFIASVCPETFSYTCREVMAMGMPVACFDIGAPAGHAAGYDKGLILSSFDTAGILAQIRNYAAGIKYSEVPAERKKARVLFVVEYESFSSRYRVGHFREQLLLAGVASDIVKTGKLKNIDIMSYSTVVIYRCRHTGAIERMINACRAAGKKVFYDIDDLIFDFGKIKHMEFLSDAEYAGFEKYSADIKACMEMCDGYIVSTNHLRDAVSEAFPGRAAVINRNAASLAMLSASMAALADSTDAGKDESAATQKDGVALIYCSGSKTHDKDFALIEDVLLELLGKYDYLKLRLAGIVNTGGRLDRYSGRIERIGFMPWQELPKVLAGADINLMPLEDSLFHRCKSENKWLEAALVSLPTVCSSNPELESVIEHGVTGYLCGDDAAWLENLSALIEDRSLRESIGKKAGAHVREHYLTANTGEDAVLFVLS